MPSRLATLVIVALWLASSAWFFAREILPRLEVDEPPPFAIHLVDEAPRRLTQVRWRVLGFREGAIKAEEDIGIGLSYVTYDAQEDTYSLEGRLRFHARPSLEMRAAGRTEVAHPIGPQEGDDERERVPGFPRRGSEEVDLGRGIIRLSEPVAAPIEVKSYYRVTREGELREFKVDLTTQAIQNSLVQMEPGIGAEVIGSVQDGYLNAHWWHSRREKTPPVELEPVKVSKYGVVFNALHPLHQLPGLYTGRQWRMPVINPFATTNVDKRPEIVRLLAQVSETKLAWGRRGEIPCHLVHMRGADIDVRIWVRESDELVLQQEVNLGGQRMLIKRYLEN